MPTALTGREALTNIAAYSDTGANEWLKETGSYGSFDEPGSVKAARQHLEDGTRLYYEVHITVEAKPGRDNPIDLAAWDVFVDTCTTAPEWKVSRFDEDQVDDYHGMWFASWRSKFYNLIEAEVKRRVRLLTEAGFTVKRWKIEETLADSNYGDTL